LSLQSQALEAFLFQVSQTVADVPLLAGLDEVDWKIFAKHLKVGYQQVGECWVTFIHVTAVAQASCIAVIV